LRSKIIFTVFILFIIYLALGNTLQVDIDTFQSFVLNFNPLDFFSRSSTVIIITMLVFIAFFAWLLWSLGGKKTYNDLKRNFF